MKLIFIRHGLAEGHFSPDQRKDFSRKLTGDGKRRLQHTFKVFKKYQPSVDVIFSSPLVRAVQTAELMWNHFKTADLELMSDLDILEDPKCLVEYISFLPSEGHYIFVGHEPHLSQSIAALLSLPPDREFMTLKKGGICVLEGGMWRGFKLELLLSPKVLREIS